MATHAGRRLLKAAARGDLDEIASALAAGADIDTRDFQMGRTALIEAVIGGHPEAVEVLIQAGADLEVREKGTGGLTALGYTGSQPRGAESARLLLAAGADLEARQTTIGATPLLWAARTGDREIVSVLIAAGADLSAVDAFGDNALSRASRNPDVADLLVTHGAVPPTPAEPATLPWPEVARDERPDHSDPVRLVRGFVLTMDDWEKQAYSSLPGSNHTALAREGGAAAQPYLSERRRYEVVVFSSPPQFEAGDALVEVRRPTRTRVEVVVQKAPNPLRRTERVFVVVSRSGEWRIDQIKERMLVIDNRYRNLLRAHPAPRPDGLSDLDLAFATLEARRPLVKADGDPLQELRAITDPAPYLGRLLALRDHPDQWVLEGIWSTIARVQTTEALEHIFALADDNPPEELRYTANWRILNDPDPRARERAQELISQDHIPWSVNDTPAGRQLLWDGWQRYRNPACIEQLVQYRDPNVAEPLAELLLDPATPTARRAGLAGMAEGIRDERVVKALRAAAERGLINRKSAVQTLIQMWALDDAEALVTPSAFSDGAEAEKWADELAFVRRVRGARGDV